MTEETPSKAHGLWPAKGRSTMKQAKRNNYPYNSRQPLKLLGPSWWCSSPSAPSGWR